MLRNTLLGLFIYFAIGTTSLYAEWDEEFLQTRFKEIDGGKIELGKLMSNSTVFIMLSTECPLCKNYTLTIKKLMKAFPNYNWLGVFPGNFYSRKEIKTFFYTYDLKLRSVIDDEYVLSKEFEASITPEVFLTNENGEVLYTGAIDDWVLELGKTRDVITMHYLRDALRQNQEGEMINISKTEAVGCKIQY
ncbi:MAG: redoxin domain-containing protein [Cytophagales bacterium]